MKRTVLVILCLVLLFAVPAQAAPQANPVPQGPAPAAPLVGAIRISQVYGGGGATTGSPSFKCDYIELFNSTGAAVSLNGWSLQYGSASNNNWVTTMHALPNISIAAHGYLLVQETCGTLGPDLPVTPDLTGGTLFMSATGGKVALVNGTTLLNACPAVGTVPDLVGYGTAICYEGAAAPGLSSILADFRANNGCTDTDNNATDFRTGTPSPRNSASPSYSCTADAPPTVTSSMPGNGATNVAPGSNVVINFNENVNVIGNWFNLTCTSSGAHSAAVTPAPPPNSFTLNPDVDFTLGEACTATVYAAQVQDADTDAEQMAGDYTWGFRVIETDFGACGDNGETLISAVQGSGVASPIVGATTVVEGVVVGSYQYANGWGGYYIQEPNAKADADPATSEGIFVYDSAHLVSAGDLVRLRGKVAEYASGSTTLTELQTIINFATCSTGQSVTPAAVSLPAPNATYLERYEGMLTNVSQPLTVTDNYDVAYYGEVGFSAYGRLFSPTHVMDPGPAAMAQQTLNDLSRIVLDDGYNQVFHDLVIYPAPGLTTLNTLRAGDSVTGLSGVLDQRFGVYRLQPTGVVNFTKANLRPTVPEPVGGTLRLASGNVLNYFLTLGSRGAANAQELARQRAKILAEILGVNPDVMALMEVESMADPGAVGDLVAGLNAATTPGTYDYIHTGVLGTDQIKVALIYKPAKVTPVGAYITSANATFSRAPLAQTFEQISTGETFSVVANHFKSKGCSGATGLDADQNDGQSCYNLRRTQQAEALAAFIDNTVIPAADDPDVFILGDLNSYAKEDPITHLKDVQYTDLAAQYGGTNGYSYAFNGQFGYLDYVMPNSGALGQVTGATDWHINADEPGDLGYGTSGKTTDQVNYLYNADSYRAADHDPVIVGLNLLGDHSNLAVSYGKAGHSIPHVAWLGATVVDDADYGPQLPSDNDGVTPGTGSGAGGRWADGMDGGSVNLKLSGNMPQTACVHGWIDWANDGSFSQNEDYAISGAMIAGSSMSVTFAIPAGTFPAAQPLTLHARFRLYDLCPDGPAQPTGSVTGGEVEDYTWNFNPTAVGLRSLQARSLPNAGWLALPGLAVLGAVVVAWRRRRSI